MAKDKRTRDQRRKAENLVLHRVLFCAIQSRRVAQDGAGWRSLPEWGSHRKPLWQVQAMASVVCVKNPLDRFPIANATQLA